MASTAGISFSGFNGFDFNQIIEAIMQQERLPLTSLQQQEQAVKDKDAALVDLGSQVAKLETSINKLTLASAFFGVMVESSDSTMVKAVLGNSALPGHYDVNVTAIAKAQVTTSTNGYANLTDIVADGGSISFTINGTTTTPITLTKATSLAELKDLINDQDTDVMASIVNDGTANRLVISSRKTGATNSFAINNSLTNSGGTVVAFAGNTQAGQDAQFTVNGISITSSSNTISNAIPGVDMTLVKVGATSVDVTTDHTSLKDTIKAFVADYNKLRDFYVKQSTPNATKAMPLANDSTLRQTLNQIKSSLLAANSNGGRYTYLAEIGIEFGQNGELKFVESAFDAAVTSSMADVKKLFQGTATANGVFDLVKDCLEDLDSTSGAIKTNRTNIETALKKFRDRIAAQELRLDVRQAELIKMYTAADQAIAQLNQMNAQLNAIRG
jgi:flagellar hook-associated protein 2